MLAPALAALLAPPAAVAAAAEAPPNVVIVDVCSARADHFGLYGYGRDTTPELDSLSRESVVFDRAMAQSSWCLPNYATLFTGHVPEVHGQYANMPLRRLPEFERTLAERLKEKGYRTASFSGGIYFLKAWGLDKGFDTYVNSFDTAAAHPAPLSRTLPEIDRWLSRAGKQPFFLYVAVDDLHAPYQSDDPERYDPGYEGVVHDTATRHVRFFRAYNGEPLEAGDPMSPLLKAFRADPRHLVHLAAHYDAALRSTDKGIGELVSRLKRRGLWDKSVFILTADHGELLGEKGLLGHTEGLYEPVLRVPLLIRHPGLRASAGRRVQELVMRVDLAPTALDMAGAPLDGELQGRSLLPLLREPGARWRPYGYASSKRNLATVSDPAIDERVIRDKRWKLHWYLYKDRFELYDLDKDPLETQEVGARHPEVLRRLSFELMRQVELQRPHAPGLPSAWEPRGAKTLEPAPLGSR